MRVKITGQSDKDIHLFEFTDFTAAEAIEHVRQLGYTVLQCAEDGKIVKIEEEDDSDVSSVV